MHIAVIAANGRSGQAFVRAALAAGHTVRAGVYKNNQLEPAGGLEIVHCDATQSEDLRQLLRAQDAVVSLIGHVKGSPANVQADAIQKVIEVMSELGIRRVVSLTGTGVRMPNDQITLIDRILNLSISLIDPARIHDGRRHVALLQASTLDWTVIRVLKLQNVSVKPFSLKLSGPTKIYVGRGEVAQAILQVLEQGSFVRQAPIIAKS